MGKGILQPQIWHKIIKGLNKTKIDYVLVGAAALVIHGAPRSTLDLDIYVPAREDIAYKLFHLADTSGLKSKERAILKFSHSPELFANQWICFSYKGQDVLDVYFTNEDEFSKLYKNSQQKKDKNLLVRVASLDDLRDMKKTSGRATDIADLALIEEIKKYKKKKSG